MHTSRYNSERSESLLARYLDGALTADERQEFDALLNTDAAFAQEVREISTVEQLLHHSQQRQSALVLDSLPFLEGIEHHIAGLLAGAGAAAATAAATTAVTQSSAGLSSVITSTSSGSALSTTTAASTATTGTTAGITASVATGAAATTTVSTASSIVSSIAASISATAGSWIAAAAVSTAALTGVYFLTKTPHNEQALAPQQPTTEQHQQASPRHFSENNGMTTPQSSATEPSDSLSATTTAATGNNASVAVEHQIQPTQQTQTSSTAEHPAEHDLRQSSTPKATEFAARIGSSGASAAQYQALIEDYQRQRQSKEAQGDKASAALLSKSLGVLYREVGRGSDARLALQRSLNDARALSIKELEGEALAELALLDASEGKRSQALDKLREALSILRSTKNPNLQRWEQELTKLERKHSTPQQPHSSDTRRFSEPRFRSQ
jgi:anti-sigma factor RsiW